jgi:hypothetical protein
MVNGRYIIYKRLFDDFMEGFDRSLGLFASLSMGEAIKRMK